MLSFCYGWELTHIHSPESEIGCNLFQLGFALKFYAQPAHFETILQRRILFLKRGFESSCIVSILLLYLKVIGNTRA